MYFVVLRNMVRLLGMVLAMMTSVIVEKITVLYSLCSELAK
ncbi:hypothetical protein ACFFLZ_11585 [Photobacterium aphoticum]|nr:hypothetical protein [Photobacterium aphoticum]